MKFLAPSLALLAALAAPAVATKHTRGTHAHSDVFRARQFHPRDYIDTCGNIDSPLTVPQAGNETTLFSIGQIDQCLCASKVSDFVESDPIAVAAVAVAGKSVVESQLSSMISAAKDATQCNYPQHATPVCSSSNPCDFTCSSGHTPSPAVSPTTCACSGGACPSSSASAAASKKRRDANWWMDAQCPSEAFSACGVPGSPKSWECVDTQSDIESCGGCTLPLHPSAPRGVDCTEIPGVASVSCVHGGCAVKSCRAGWTVSPSGDSCVEVDSDSDESSTYDRILQAVHFGLEHVPLRR